MTIATHYNQICGLLCRMRAIPKRHVLTVGDNTPGFDTYAVPSKMIRNRRFSHAVISFLVRCNGYRFDRLARVRNGIASAIARAALRLPSQQTRTRSNLIPPSRK